MFWTQSQHQWDDFEGWDIGEVNCFSLERKRIASDVPSHIATGDYVLAE